MTAEISHLFAMFHKKKKNKPQPAQCFGLVGFFYCTSKLASLGAEAEGCFVFIDLLCSLDLLI